MDIKADTDQRNRTKGPEINLCVSMGQLIFNKGAKNTYGGKGSLSTDGAGKLDIQIYKNEIGPFSYMQKKKKKLKMD